MSKVFGLILMLVALYIGMTLQTEGMQQAFGGVFAPIEPIGSKAPTASALSDAAQSSDAPSGPRTRLKITDAVRNRVSADLQQGAERRGY